MSNYTQTTNFATKDALASGNPLKIVKGTEINTEFANIATAVATKSDSASPTFTGTVTIPTLAVSGVATLTSQPILSSLTASKPVFTDASKGLVSTGTLGADQGGTGVANNAAMTVTGSGNFAFTRTLTGTTNVTLPTTGTLATLAGTFDFTGIPSWVKRITVMFTGVSTNGGSVIQVQLGTGSTTYTTTGYLGSSLASTNGASPLIILQTAGMAIGPDGAATFIKHGTLVITNITGNTWVGNGNGANSEIARVWTCGSSIALAAVLTAVRITTVNGTDTFDAGTVNILFE